MKNRSDDLEQTFREKARLEVLLVINRAVSTHLERTKLFDAVAGAARRVVDFDAMAIGIPDVGAGQVRLYASSKRGDHLDIRQAGESIPLANSLPGWVIEHNEIKIKSDPDDVALFPASSEVLNEEGMRAVLGCPLSLSGERRGVILFKSVDPDAFGRVDRVALAEMCVAIAAALDNSIAYEEVKTLRDRLSAENRYLRQEIQTVYRQGELVGNSPPIVELRAKLVRVAATPSVVLIEGETGTGKEVVARHVHANSARSDRALVRVNCAAISAGLVESELFGHEQGAFTGALRRHIGRFELAHEGTLFLDEVGELPLSTQVKLLRVLQEGEFERVGSSQTRSINVRIIAATNRNLRAAIKAGTFRDDLYYRLNVFPLSVPALRERGGDVELLADHFLAQHSRRLGKEFVGITEGGIRRLAGYSWPGNVRELQNIIERAIILEDGPMLELRSLVAPPEIAISAHVPAAPLFSTGRQDARADSELLTSVESEHIKRVLESVGWVIEGKSGAAIRLGIHPNTLRSRMRKLCIRRPP